MPILQSVYAFRSAVFFKGELSYFDGLIIFNPYLIGCNLTQERNIWFLTLLVKHIGLFTSIDTVLLTAG